MKDSLWSTLGHGWEMAQRLTERVRSSRYSLAPARRSDPDLAAILAHWSFGDFKAKRIAMGGSGANWMVATREGKYVLRNAGQTSAYVRFQVRVINHIAQSGFPYQTPRLLEARDGGLCEQQGEVWLLYPFIEGYSAREIATAAEAADVGRLVAEYHQAVGGIEGGYLENFATKLFQVEETCALLREKTAAIRPRKRRRKSADLWLQLADSVLALYAAIPEATIRSIHQLSRIAIYNDWYPDNILMVDRRIVGLIDFDSVLAGPAILDFQNALLYAAGTRSGFEMDRIRAFAEGYTSVRPLSTSDLGQVFPLMVDRILFLVARAMRAGWPEGAHWKHGLIVFLLHNLACLIDRQEEFCEHLLAAERAASSHPPPQLRLQ